MSHILNVNLQCKVDRKKRELNFECSAAPGQSAVHTCCSCLVIHLKKGFVASGFLILMNKKLPFILLSKALPLQNYFKVY